MAYDVNTGIISAPVSFKDVQTALETSENRLKYLCIHPNVNIWSKNKPRFMDISIKNINASIPYGNNFVVKQELYNSENIYYLITLPLEQGMFYNLHDFNGYNHIAEKPKVKFTFLDLFSGEHTLNYIKYITRAELLKNVMAYNGGNIDYSGDARPLALETPTSYIWPNDLVVNSNDEIEISGAFNTLSKKAYWIFDDVSFNNETTLITFMDPGNSNRICLDREDAIAIPTSVVFTGIFSRHTTIDPHIGGSTIDVPMKPIIKFGTVTPPDTDVYAPDFFFIKELWLRARDSTSQGGGIAYSIFLDFAADYHKYGGKSYYISITPRLYILDYTSKTKVIFDEEAARTNQYIDNGGTPNFGQIQTMMHTFSSESSYDSKWIHLTSIPFDDVFTGIWEDRSLYAIELEIVFTQV